MPAYILISNIWATTWQNQQKGCAPSEDSGQPGHPPSLIRVFAVRMKKAWVLSYSLSARRRLWSDWADAQADLSLRWAHSHFVCFCHVAAQEVPQSQIEKNKKTKNNNNNNNKKKLVVSIAGKNKVRKNYRQGILIVFSFENDTNLEITSAVWFPCSQGLLHWMTS